MNAIGDSTHGNCKFDREAGIDWNAIRIFLAIEAEGDLAAAARALSLSHSTVFRRLKALEDTVGARLFDRLGGRYELTEAGDALLPRARAVADEMDGIVREIAGRDREPAGTVRITAPASFALDFLPNYLKDLADRHPGIRAELLVANQELNMSSRAADIAVRVTPAPPDHLVGRQVASIGWSAYAAADPPLDAPPSGIDDLAGRPLIGGAGALAAHRAFAWLDRHHGERIGFRSDDLPAMARAAAAGLAIAFLPDEMDGPGLARLFAFPPPGRNALWVLTHPDLRKVERIRTVMAHLGDAFSRDSRLAPLD